MSSALEQLVGGDSKPTSSALESLVSSGSPTLRGGNYMAIGGGSDDPIHYGTHKGGGVYDITTREAKKHGKTLEQIAGDLAGRGYIAAVRKKGQRGITNDHVHFVDPKVNKGEAARLRGQAKGGFIYLPEVGRSGQSISAAKPLPFSVKLRRGLRDAGEVVSGAVEFPLRAASTLADAAAAPFRAIPAVRNAEAEYNKRNPRRKLPKPVQGFVERASKPFTPLEVAQTPAELGKFVAKPFIGSKMATYDPVNKQWIPGEEGAIESLAHGRLPTAKAATELGLLLAPGVFKLKGKLRTAREVAGFKQWVGEQQAAHTQGVADLVSVIEQRAIQQVQPEQLSVLSKTPQLPALPDPVRPGAQVKQEKYGKTEASVVKVYRGEGLPESEKTRTRTPAQYAVGEHWTTDKDVAASYGPNVREESVRLENPYMLTLENKKPYYEELQDKFGTSDPQEITMLLKSQGHDGLVVENVPVMRQGVSRLTTEIIRFESPAPETPGASFPKKRVYVPKQAVKGAITKVPRGMLNESGKASTKALLTAGALSAGVFTALPVVKKWSEQGPGEDAGVARKFFEGGVLSKLLDALQVGNFAVASATKGLATGEPERIPEFFGERTTFSDENLTGLIADMALDPLSWVSLGTIVPIKAAAKYVPFTEKIKAAAESIGKTRTLQKLLDTWEFNLGFSARADTLAARKALEKEYDQYVIDVSKSLETAQWLAKQIQAAGPEADKDVARVVDAGWKKAAREGTRKGVEFAKKQVLDEIERTNGKEYRDTISTLYHMVTELEDEMGNALVKSGHMEQNVADAWKKVHLRRIFERFEDVDAYIDGLRLTDPQKAAELNSRWQAFKRLSKGTSGKIDYSAVMRREDLPQEILDVLHEVPYSSARLISGQAHASELVAKSAMYRRLANSVAVDADTVASKGLFNKYMQVPATDDVITVGKEQVKAGKYFGDLAGKWVPNSIYWDLINSVPRETHYTFLSKAVQKTVAWWKMGKVPLSLPTSARNLLSNIVLADVLGKTSPYRVDLYYDAAKSLASQDKWYQEARQAGTFLHDTLISSEVRNIIEASSRHDPYTRWQAVKKALGYIPNKAGDVYEFNERWFKMAVYINSRKVGLDAVQAAEVADKALFNYRKLPKALDTMRRHGVVPFIAFPYKAIPAITKAMWTDTGRVSKYAKAIKAVEEQTPEDIRAKERGVQPGWMEGMVRLPGEKSRYFDLSYINPYAGIGEENFAAPRLGSMAAPLPFMGAEVALNKSGFFGDEIAGAGLPVGEQVRRRFVEYPAQFLAPSMTPPIPYVLPQGGTVTRSVIRGLTGQGTPKTIGESTASLAGLKTITLDEKKERRSRALGMKQAVKDARREILRVRRGKSDSKLSPGELQQIEAIRQRLHDRLNELSTR